MPCRILVADDSTPIQKVIRIAFSKYHVDIVTAGSLAEAIKEAERTKPEFVIVDASLPGISTGSDFSKLVTKVPDAAMVVLMGTYDSVREADIRSAGLSTILKKPFDAMELLEASEKLLPGRLKPAGNTGFTKENVLPTPPPAPAQRATMPGIPSFLLDEEPLAPPTPSVESKLDLAKKGLPAFDPALSAPVPPRIPTATARTPEPVFSVSAESTPIPAAVRKATAGSFDIVGKTAGSSTEGSGLNPSNVSIAAAVEEYVRRELPGLVDRAVERYCNENFKGIAREVLTAELRRLAEEKARFLVDQ